MSTEKTSCLPNLKQHHNHFHSQKFYVHLLIHYNGFPFRPHVTAFMFYELWVFHVIRQYFKLSNPIIEEAAI